MIIGAARSATTSISQILGSHPDICFSKPKEPQFFSDPNWRSRLDWYHNLFEGDAKYYAEGSTNYTKSPHFNPEIHREIFEYNPDVKLIYVIRHPIDRIQSHYAFAVERGYTTNDISTELQSNSIYLDSSKYYSQVKPYLDLFGKDQLELVFFEDFIRNPVTVMSRLFEFLDLRPVEIPNHLIHSNKSRTGQIGPAKFDSPKTLGGKIAKLLNWLKRKLLPAPSIDTTIEEKTKTDILKKLEQEIRAIEELTGRNLNDWLQS